MRESLQDKVLQEFKVKEPAELLEFLLNKQIRKSRNAIKSLLAHKQINVNGKLVTQFNLQLKTGDQVCVMKFNQARKKKKLSGLTIMFEDEYIIVVEKESGLLSVATEKEKQKTAFYILNQYVKTKKKDARIYVLHRLDREISGLMIFAKNEEVQTAFQKNWDRIISLYTYAAIIEGELTPADGKITSWLTENKNYMVFSSSIDNGGQLAVTQYKTMKQTKRYALVNFDMETRRKNQIRAQLNQLHHPVVGDKKYGASGNPIKRIAMHAQEMVLIHPVTSQKLEFKTTLPKTMQDFIEKSDK